MKSPLYKRIYDDIYQAILNGERREGDRLPSENELEKQYNVSKTPIRQALNKLENDGYIYRLQGKGSFVANIKPIERWTMTTGFGDNFKKEWKKISANSLFAGYTQSKKFAKMFGLKENSNLIHLKRIRYFNNEPLVYMEHYIKPIVPLNLFTDNSSSVSSVGQIIKQHLNTDFSNINEQVEAIVSTDKLSKLLKVKKNFPLLKIKRFSYFHDDLIDINIYYVRTDQWKYNIEFN